jgi:hypothetical protein
MLNELAATGLPIHSREDAGVRSGIYNEIDLRQIVDVTLNANIARIDFNAGANQWRPVQFRSRSTEVVDTNN